MNFKIVFCVALAVIAVSEAASLHRFTRSPQGIITRRVVTFTNTGPGMTMSPMGPMMPMGPNMMDPTLMMTTGPSMMNPMGPSMMDPSLMMTMGPSMMDPMMPMMTMGPNMMNPMMPMMGGGD